MTNDKYYILDVMAKRIVGEKNGKKYDFMSYKVIDKNGKMSTLKFTQACTPPTTNGRFNIQVPKNAINRDCTNFYPTFWCQHIDACVPRPIAVETAENNLPF